MEQFKDFPNIDRAQANQLERAHSLSQSILSEFETLDKNRDGKIVQDEIRQANNASKASLKSVPFLVDNFQLLKNLNEKPKKGGLTRADIEDVGTLSEVLWNGPKRLADRDSEARSTKFMAYGAMVGVVVGVGMAFALGGKASAGRGAIMLMGTAGMVLGNKIESYTREKTHNYYEQKYVSMQQQLSNLKYR